MGSNPSSFIKNRLLLLVLVPGAAPADVAEGLWILQHHRPYDHSIVVHPDDDHLLACHSGHPTKHQRKIGQQTAN